VHADKEELNKKTRNVENETAKRSVYSMRLQKGRSTVCVCGIGFPTASGHVMLHITQNEHYQTELTGLLMSGARKIADNIAFIYLS
jgi:hypothetical protein